MATGVGVTGSKNNIGRFIPASFAVTVGDNFESQCTGFSYSGFSNGVIGLNKSGQSDSLTINVQALNSNNQPTRNYDDVFAKLESGTISISGFDVTTASAATGTVTAGSIGTPNFQTNGRADNIPIPDVFYQYDNFAAPFELRIDIDATDVDGVNGTASSNSVEQRLGRSRLVTAYGPEVEPLNIPLYTEFFNGTDWVINTADSCTSYISSDLQFVSGTYQGDLNAGETSITLPASNTLLTAGESGVNQGFGLTAPGVGNSGEVNVEHNLSALDWLRFDWNSDNSNDNPQATAGFGRYRGSDRVIYWREN